MDVKPVSQWMETPEATALACVSKKTLDRLVRQGRIGVLRIPGVVKTMYSRGDVEALVNAGIKPATNGTRAATHRGAMAGA